MMHSTPSNRAGERWLPYLFLAWNLVGCAAFIMQSSQDLGVLARTDPYQARLWAAMPLWAWISYGGAVLASTLGTLAMILRRRIAVLLSLVGLVAVLLQFGYTFLGTDVLQVLGFVAAAAFPITIVLLSAAQLGYARLLQNRGRLR
ncbi:MAG TPA: sugar transporter [Sphingobium sp.]|nr:sugar transporter [Sphingobium sp.]